MEGVGCSLSEGPYRPGGVLSDYEGGGKGGPQFGDPKVYSRTDPTLLTRFTKFDKFTRSTRISRFTTTIFSIQFPPESSHACDNFDLFVNTFHNIYKSSMPSSLISTFVARMSCAQVHVCLYSGGL